MEKEKSRLHQVKVCVFTVIALIDNTKFKNKILLLVVELLELLVLHYFYINPKYTFLHDFQYFKEYFESIYPQFIIISSQQDFIQNVLFLSILPCLLVIGIFLALVQNNYYVNLLLQTCLLVMGLFNIKIVLEIISLFSMTDSVWVYIGSVMALISILMLGLIFILFERKIRVLELFLVLMI